MTQLTASVLPQVIDYLVTAWPNLDGFAAVTVVDGLPSGPLDSTTAGVGITSAELLATGTGDIATSVQTIMDTFYESVDEVLNLSCCIAVSLDDADDQKTARDTAFNLLSAVRTGIFDDKTLGGLVKWAVLTGYDYKQSILQDRGMFRAALIDFTIQVRALVNLNT